MKRNIIFFNALFCAILLTTSLVNAQESDFDNDTIVDRLDVDDDNDGLLDTTECPAISGAATPASDKISWEIDQFKVFTIGNNTNGLGYQESGFQKEVYDRGQPLTVLNGASDYSFPSTSWDDGSANSSVGTFANGTMTFQDNDYVYRSWDIDEFRSTTYGAAMSGDSGSGVYIYPESGSQTGDYYDVFINFTEPVASFSFDFVDAYDTNTDTAVVNYEVYADGTLVAYFSNAYLGDDATGNINLYDAAGTLKGSVLAGQNIENTIGFVTSDPVSQVTIRHIIISGGLEPDTHDPHGLDTFAYSFLCKEQLDIDVDNDGIPDNVEAQETLNYLPPSGVVRTSGASIGLYTNYGTGLMPVNTDNTDLPDYLDTDTDNDGILDRDENGHVYNIFSSADTDDDGLVNIFDEESSVFDSNDEVSVGDTADLVKSFGDLDSDVSSGGDLDFRDDKTIIIGSSTVDFDGEDDYLDTPNFISNWTEATIMGWVKIDGDNNYLPDLFSIAGQENIRLYISSGRTPNFVVLTQQQITTSGSNYPPNNFTVAPDYSLGLTIESGLWYHIAGVFDASTSTIKLYVNGELVGTETDPDLNSELLTKNMDGSSHIYSGREFTIGRYPTNTSFAGFGHLDGNIDEVRVFQKALSTDQLQSIVYQEIENNLGYLKGTVIDKDILDFTTSERVQWSSLEAYYPMTNIVDGITYDESNSSRNLTLHHINTVQPQTAPMPYETITDGAWTTESTWLHGDVWDIEDLPNKDWSIVHVKDNVTTSGSHTNLGLMIDSNKTLTVTGDNQVKNRWYLELDGTLDLMGDSQLVQTDWSDLEITSAGKLLRRQEGTNNVYRYNYWSSPVGAQSTVSNNTNFKVNMLNDANGDLQFTSGTTPATTTPATLSTYWLYTYKNGVTYYQWAPLTETSDIEPGVGYTQKGTGVGSTDFQYIFEGKPNNGDILINVNDAGGPGSVGGVSKTKYLLGNPYPSAIDANAFIDDNVGLINGALYFWEQWAGNSHVLDQYEGGYATLNKVGGVKAYQFVGLNGANNGVQSGTKTPKRYIPVAQGFQAEIIGSGDVEFNNDQRVFKKEATNESQFLRTNNTTTQETSDTDLQVIRLGFETSSNLNRELLLAFGNNTSDNQFDYGYDAKASEVFANDLLSTLNNEKYAIQAYSPIQNDKEVALVLNSDASVTYTIKMIETENIDASQEIYLYDTLEGVYHDLRTGDYNFSALAGEDADRFKVVFNSGDALSNEEFESNNTISIFVNNNQNQLYIKGLNQEVKVLNLVNMLGQNVMRLSNVNANQVDSGVTLGSLSTGVYIVDVTLKDGRILSKKVTIN
ncbi:LamG-like jellyroll fold domain-containing protein [Olleya sp. R77988]|uniref:LamG-like jellyroll fold domain-containing protein n=1 Tax=Olleya sp. R77988 TaxID=3093875 RepID=UPI0037C60361